MTASVRRTLCLVLVLPFFALGLVVTGSGAAQATPAHYKPHTGATFNNPFGTNASRFAINNKLIKTINSVKRGHKIRIASWNFRSTGIAHALVAAHHRGVSVRLIMDYSNWNPDIVNGIARRTQAELRQGNKHRPKDMTSWLRRCHGACRGPHGIAHTKFYTFDKVGNTKFVSMYGSANATLLAATIQWNDIYTIKGESRYNEFITVFNQMAKQRTVKQGYLHIDSGQLQLGFYPYRGAHTKKDPVLSTLNKIRCTGATGGTGIGGHTEIRIAQTATYGPRGNAIAKRLAVMHRRGCNIRIVYAMFGGDVLKMLRGAGIPLTHLAYDRNCDGIYDKYVHMKSMTVSGVYGNDTHARITWNGSANWTAVSLASDEVVGRWVSGKVTKVYSNWIDFLFTHVPAAWIPGHCIGQGSVTDRARARHVDPYALIKQDL